MTQKHPITPPPELVQQWRVEAANRQYVSLEFDEYIAEEAAQYGADQELEACCEWLHWQNLATHPELIPSLRADRRPKPPSLKEQAQAELKRLIALIPTEGAIAMAEPIRRALEQLNA
jgi:hypothetical protein